MLWGVGTECRLEEILKGARRLDSTVSIAISADNTSVWKSPGDIRRMEIQIWLVSHPTFFLWGDKQNDDFFTDPKRAHLLINYRGWLEGKGMGEGRWREIQTSQHLNSQK